MIEKLVPENDFATAFNEINSQPTRAKDFLFLQAQQQSLQQTQQAIVSQIAQISSQMKSIEVQRQQDKANPKQSEIRASYSQQQQNYQSRGGYHRGGQYNSRGNGRVICRNFGKRVIIKNFAGTKTHRREIHKYLSNSNNMLLVRSIITLFLHKIEKKNLIYPTMNKSKEQSPLFYIQIVIGNLTFDALVDTCPFTNALQMRIYSQIADSIVSKNSTPTTEIYTATGQKERCLFSTEIPLRVVLAEFKSLFLVIH